MGDGSKSQKAINDLMGAHNTTRTKHAFNILKVRLLKIK
jgi:hypothetical protein